MPDHPTGNCVTPVLRTDLLDLEGRLGIALLYADKLPESALRETREALVMVHRWLGWGGVPETVPPASAREAA